MSRTLPFLCRIGIRISGDMAGLRPKAPTGDERQYGTNTARDGAAAATKPPSVGPTMILTFESMAMAELMSLSSTGSSVRYAG